MNKEEYIAKIIERLHDCQDLELIDLILLLLSKGL